MAITHTDNFFEHVIREIDAGFVGGLNAPAVVVWPRNGLLRSLGGTELHQCLHQFRAGSRPLGLPVVPVDIDATPARYGGS